MPINVPVIVGLVALVLGIAAYAKTRRLGPVVGVAVGAFVLMAISDPGLLDKGGNAVIDAFNWFFDQLSF